jgi:hypothetical protein
LRHINFRRRVCLPTLKAAGLPAIYFHDFRDTGNHLTAEAGATLRELMERMGHSTTRAALSYLASFSGLSLCCGENEATARLTAPEAAHSSAYRTVLRVHVMTVVTADLG